MVKSKIIAGIEFKTQKSLTEYCQHLLYDVDISQPEHQTFLRDLINYHSEASEKIGCGIERFYIGPRQEYDNICFHVLRLDGSTTDFSFHNCVKNPPHKERVDSALRDAIYYQTHAFSLEAFKYTSVITCPLTNEQITYDQADVDHKDPQFNDLVKEFLTYVEITYDDVKLNPHKDHDTKDTLEDKSLESCWQRYHQKYAVLQVVKDKANQRKPRK